MCTRLQQLQAIICLSSSRHKTQPKMQATPHTCAISMSASTSSILNLSSRAFSVSITGCRHTTQKVRSPPFCEPDLGPSHNACW